MAPKATPSYCLPQVELERGNTERFSIHAASDVATEIGAVRAELPVETAQESVDFLAARNKLAAIAQALKEGLAAATLLRGGAAAEATVAAALEVIFLLLCVTRPFSQTLFFTFCRPTAGRPRVCAL